jgi:hypothetical protein
MSKTLSVLENRKKKCPETGMANRVCSRKVRGGGEEEKGEKGEEGAKPREGQGRIMGELLIGGVVL